MQERSTVHRQRNEGAVPPGYLWNMTHRPFLLGLALLASSPLVLGQRGPDAIVETKTFHVPGQGERVDVIISVLGRSSAITSNDHGFLQSRVEAITIIEKAGAIIDYRKTVVNGPERTDSLRPDFVHVESFLLQPGDHDLTVELRDLVTGDTTASNVQWPLPVGAAPDGLFFSDVLLASSMEKAPGSATARSGYEVIPFTSTYYLLSRVVYARLAKDRNEELRYDSEINQLALKLPSFGDLGAVRLWVWRRP